MGDDCDISIRELDYLDTSSVFTLGLFRDGVTIDGDLFELVTVFGKGRKLMR